MTRLTTNINLPSDPSQLAQRVTELLRAVNEQVNALTEGNLHAVHSARTAAPTTGTWAKGDFVRKSDTAEAGSASSKYVITGWICTVSGTPGTWLECRVLTGN